MTIAIRAGGLSRSFGPKIDLKRRSGEAVWQHVRAILGLPAKSENDRGVQRVTVTRGTVLRNVSLEIEKGTIVCLAGPPESGKSVLLRILSGALTPTEGRIELVGTVSRLLYAGENLDESLSALENIENERQLRGISAVDTEALARDVIAFAGLERFERVPVRQYSTGMSMRLSLALAMQGNPDILLLDDVLGVGDIAFQQRCVERLLELKAAGCAIVMVLSDDALVGELATRIITLDGGGIVADNRPGQGPLEQHDSGRAEVSWQVAPSHHENDMAVLRSVTVDRANDGCDIDIGMVYDLKKVPQRCRPTIIVLSGRIRVLRSIYPSFLQIDEPQTLRFAVRLPVHLLNEGRYLVGATMLSLHENRTHSLKHTSAVSVEVRRNSAAESNGAIVSPLLMPNFPWEIHAVGAGS